MPPNTSRTRDGLFLEAHIEALRDRTILIAGVGADGSTAAESLSSVVHSSDAKILIADPDTYDEGNTGIQVFRQEDKGKNKAQASADFLKSRFPGLNIDVFPQGITTENTEDLVGRSDFIIDATDVSVAEDVAVKMHEFASSQNKSVIVPWSLGFGGATMVCSKPSDFKEWGEEAFKIASDLGLDELAPLARWMVHAPKETTLNLLRKILSGDIPTPTTYFGAVSGGHLATKQVICLASGIYTPKYPYTTVIKSEIDRTEQIVGDFRELIHNTLKSLK